MNEREPVVHENIPQKVDPEAPRNRIYLDPDRWRSNRHGLPPGMSPAERIAARVRHRTNLSKRSLLANSVREVASVAEEIEELKAKAAREDQQRSEGEPAG